MDKKYTVKFTATIEVEVEASGEITARRLAARQLDPDVDWDFEGVREGWDSDV